MTHGGVEVSVNFLVKVISGTDHSQDISGLRVYGHHGVILTVKFLFINRAIPFGYFFGILLNRVIKSGDDFKTAIGNRILAVFFNQLVNDEKYKMRRFDTAGILSG